MKQKLRNFISSEYYRVTYIFWGIILYQYVILLSHLWLPETTEIVTWTLLLTLLTELIPGMHRMFRRAFQLIGILYVHLFVLQAGLIGGSVDRFSDVFALIKLNLEQFTPYLWFSLAGWLLYVWTMRWTTSKPIIYTVIISSVIMFCIIDSFSFLILWDQVALIIVSGLMLIIIHHFTEFRRKHPESWNYLKQYPGSIIRTVIILLSFVIVAGLTAPNMRPILTDPYTAWKNYQGEPVKTMGKGFNPVNVSTLNGASGYSRDDRMLGSGFNFDYSSVMSVDTTHGSYWRGETRDFYTGRGWESSDDIVVANVALGEDFEEEEWFDASQLETVEAMQTFHQLDDRSYPVLFGAYRMKQLTRLEPSADSNLLWVPEDSELRWNREQNYPESYSVVSELPVIDEAKLREAGTTIRHEGLMNKYVQLPDTVTERTKELARTITADADNDYDRVKAIEQYLKMNYIYNNRPDYSKIGEDFVDSFLFEIREGYCDYYSTAMAVLVRSLGIPARWVKGYTTGSQPFEDEYEFYLDFETSESIAELPGYYIVNNSNAHSWVEVYFEGYGWIPFEPTSGFSLPLLHSVEQIEYEPVQASAVPEDNDSEGGTSWLTVIAIAAWAALFSFATWLLYVYRGSMQRWLKIRNIGQAARDPRNSFIIEFNRFLKYAGRKGFDRYNHETVRETLSRWKKQSSWLPDELEELVQLFELAKYSRMELSEASLNKGLMIIDEVKKQMK